MEHDQVEIKMDTKELLELHRDKCGNIYLSGMDLSNKSLRWKDLSNADLSYANLENVNLENANLQNVNLCGAKFRRTSLANADLKGADLDYSSMQLSCRDLRAHYDDKQIIQQLYHVLSHVKYSKNASDRLKDILLTDDIIALANEFHRTHECGVITKKERK